MIELTTTQLQNISQLTTTSNLIAVVKLPERIDSPVPLPALVLDTIQDPGNLGTIIRTADWFQFKTLVLSPQTVSWHSSKVIQASMGSFLRIRLVEKELVPFLSGQSHPVYGAALSGPSIYQENLSGVKILVLGNESQGISAELFSWVTHPVKIPGFGRAESLNVGVAAGIICAEIQRQQIVRDSVNG